MPSSPRVTQMAELPWLNAELVQRLARRRRQAPAPPHLSRATTPTRRVGLLPSRHFLPDLQPLVVVGHIAPHQDALVTRLDIVHEERLAQLRIESFDDGPVRD